MDGGPQKTGKRSAKVNVPGLHDRKPSAHDRHFTPVEIAKRAWLGFACCEPLNCPAGIAPLLNRDLCDAWQRAAALVQTRSITDHEDFAIARNSKSLVHAHAASVIRVP